MYIHMQNLYKYIKINNFLMIVRTMYLKVLLNYYRIYNILNLNKFIEVLKIIKQNLFEKVSRLCWKTIKQHKKITHIISVCVMLLDLNMNKTKTNYSCLCYHIIIIFYAFTNIICMCFLYSWIYVYHNTKNLQFFHNLFFELSLLMPCQQPTIFMLLWC